MEAEGHVATQDPKVVGNKENFLRSLETDSPLHGPEVVAVKGVSDHKEGIKTAPAGGHLDGVKIGHVTGTETKKGTERHP